MKTFILGIGMMLLLHEGLGFAQRATEPKTTAQTLADWKPSALVVRMYCISSYVRDEWEPCKDIKEGEHFLGIIPGKEDARLLIQNGISDRIHIDRSCWTDEKGNVK